MLWASDGNQYETEIDYAVKDRPFTKTGGELLSQIERPNTSGEDMYDILKDVPLKWQDYRQSENVEDRTNEFIMPDNRFGSATNPIGQRFSEEPPITQAPYPEKMPAPRLKQTYEPILEKITKLGTALKPLFTAKTFTDQKNLITEEDYARAHAEYTSLEKAAADFAMLATGQGVLTGPLRAGVGIFGGRLGLKQGELDLLKRAQKLEDEGIDALTIKRQTGFEKNPMDKQWRLEMDDSKMKVNERFINSMVNDVKQDTPSYDRLGNLISHPELFERYPKLKDIRVQIVKRDDDLSVVVGKGVNAEIHINEQHVGKNLKSLLAHEIQHIIQDFEGFAKGGIATEGKTFAGRSSAALMKDIEKARQETDAMAETVKKLGHKNPEEHFTVKTMRDLTKQLEEFLPERLAGDRYYNLAGEVEARNVQKRLEMTYEQRRKSLASFTQDREFYEQILKRTHKE